MKILRICPEFYSEEKLEVGLSAHIRNLTKAINNEGIEQTILTQNTDLTEFEGIKIIKYKSKKPLSQIRSGLFAYEEIKKMKEKFDIIQFHNPGAALISLKNKKLPPIIMTLHGSPIELWKNKNFFNFRSLKEAAYYYFMAKFASNKVSKIITVSEFVSKSIENKWQLKKGIVETITSGVNTDLFKPDKKIKKEIDIIFVGRFAPKKQPLVFLELVKKLQIENPKIKALMIGGNAQDIEFNNVKRFISKNNLKKIVKIMPPIKQKELPKILNKSKILILPSLSEGTAKVILEAMACSVPVITTNILGNIGTTINGETGFLINKHDSKELFKKTKEILENDNLREKLGKTARTHAINKFSWTSKAKQYKKLYSKL